MVHLDPFNRIAKVADSVVRGEDKKYFRFRETDFYGGIATADSVGCNLLCTFCWNWRRNQDFENEGTFYTPKFVANRLEELAEENGYRKVRITGGEPTVGRNHLLKVLENVSDKFIFVLETNGLLLGSDESYVKDLSSFRNLHVRVSFKGIDKTEFGKLTGADPEFFENQFKAVSFLEQEGMSYHVSVMSLKKDYKRLKERLASINPGMQLEEEKLKLYPSVEKRMKEQNML